MLLAGLAVAAPQARADGDPASDVLAAQSLFIPADGGFSPSEQVRLTALLGAAQRSGFPIRVALIARPSDLGSVSQLWAQPRAYASFLGAELSLVFHGTLLVVMPDGFGVTQVGGGTSPSASVIPVPARGTPMTTAALDAVQRLAGAAGHQLALPAASVPAASGSSWLASVDLGSWLVLAGGAALIAAAWAASARARPLRTARRAPGVNG